MTAEEFNIKYKDYIEPGFEDQGLEINNKDCVEVLDSLFEDFIKIPGFQFSQIKTKFTSVRFYSNLTSYSLQILIENELEDILFNTN